MYSKDSQLHHRLSHTHTHMYQHIMYNFSNSNQNDCKHLNDEQTEMCLISKCRTVGQVDAPEMNTHWPSGTDTYAYIR